MSLPMSRRNIADYLGLQIETVSRVVSRLQCDGVLRFIGKTHREIAILDPLAQGRFASDPVLAEIGARHNASAAQVALKWLLDQDGVAALPKDKRCVNPGFAPAWD
jgi:diketogulonate reductase-like aldo/keto reductase